MKKLRKQMMELKIRFSSCTYYFLVLQDSLMARSQAKLELTEMAIIQLNEMVVSMDLPLYQASDAWDVSASSNIFLLFSTAHVLLNAMKIVKRLNQKDLCFFFSLEWLLNIHKHLYFWISFFLHHIIHIFISLCAYPWKCLWS